MSLSICDKQVHKRENGRVSAHVQLKVNTYKFFKYFRLACDNSNFSFEISNKIHYLPLAWVSVSSKFHCLADVCVYVCIGADSANAFPFLIQHVQHAMLVSFMLFPFLFCLFISTYNGPRTSRLLCYALMVFCCALNFYCSSDPSTPSARAKNEA